MTETELRKQRARSYARKHRYGITEEQYQSLLIEQNNMCAVCDIEFSDKVKPQVDHDHNCCAGAKSCGVCLRGLLCSHCVTFASFVETRFKDMDKMFQYLTHHLKMGRRNK